MKNKFNLLKNQESDFKTMELGGYKFPYNPSSFEIIFEKNFSIIQLPFKKDCLQNLGTKTTIVKGEGEFFGKDIFLQFENLERVFHEKGGKVLILPSKKEIEAVFTKLKIVGEAGPNILKYYFEFHEINNKYLDENFSYSDLVMK